MKIHRSHDYSDVKIQKTERLQGLMGQIEPLIWVLVRLALLVALVLALAWFGLRQYQRVAEHESLRLQTIEVKPVLHYGDAKQLQEHVLRHLHEKQSMNMIDIDVQALAEDLQQIAWVSGVQVRKQGLRSLVLEVEERVPLFRWGKDEWIDAAGVRFKVPANEETLSLFEIYGPDGRERMVLQYAEVLKPWLDEQKIPVSALWVDRDRRWYMDLGENVRIVLGLNISSERMKRLSFAYHRVLKSILPLVEELNFAHPTGVVVTLRKEFMPVINENKDGKLSK
ncbi:MAG: cell division protein FtsQ/DivIB [Cardiobacteriaceae bacterium]|nr:cell division protein FtsQ/DivIB [Cardiobacteriaceae bacterium]